MTYRPIATTALLFPAEAVREQGWLPSADVYRSPDGWLIKLDLAGVRQGDVCIELSGTKLMISGFRRDWVVNEDWSHYSMEIAYSRFERLIELPCLEEQTKINAELREGMLLIYLTPEGEGR
jgi:HSP20 family protein